MVWVFCFSNVICLLVSQAESSDSWGEEPSAHGTSQGEPVVDWSSGYLEMRTELRRNPFPRHYGGGTYPSG